MKEDLYGALVILSHSAENGNATMRIGRIHALHLHTHQADITFFDLHRQRVKIKEIRILKNRSLLYRLLLAQTRSISSEAFKTLFQINMLQDRGDMNSVLRAYKLLQANPSLIPSATDPLTDRLALPGASLHSVPNPSLR